MTGPLKRKLLSLIRAIIRTLVTWAALPQPGRITVQLLREELNMLVYSAVLPTPTDADVVSQELTVDIDGVPTTSTESVGATVTIKAPDNANVTLTLVNIDDASNRSEPRVQSFVATDTIAPAAPGEIAVTLTGEE